MPLIPRTRRRREMTLVAGVRRRIQRLGPYQSMVLLAIPVAVVEPLKLVSLFVAGKGHWLTGTGMIVACQSPDRGTAVQSRPTKADDTGLVRKAVGELCSFA